MTLCYFLAIWEKTGYIRDAMRLRNIRGVEKAETMAVLLMILATDTAEELSVAAMTREIEDPVPKTSIAWLSMGILGWGCLAVGAGI